MVKYNEKNASVKENYINKYVTNARSKVLMYSTLFVVVSAEMLNEIGFSSIEKLVG